MEMFVVWENNSNFVVEFCRTGSMKRVPAKGNRPPE